MLNSPIRKIEQTTESYSPKKKPEILNALNNSNQTFEEKIAILPKSDGIPPDKSKIENIHRIYTTNPSENFMFSACVRSVLESLGEDKNTYDYVLTTALCGDLFTQMYCKDKESDSLMDNCFSSEVAVHAFKMCGYECVFFTHDEIRDHLGEVMKAIKQSILRNSPVISIGVANIPLTKDDGEKVWNGTTPIVDKKAEVPFGSLVGGYDNDQLLINVWLGEAVTEENGYATTDDALSLSKGILIVGSKINCLTMGEVYRNIISTLPIYLTLSEKDGYLFGKEAFYKWADNIRSNEISKMPNKWNMHSAPAVILYTNSARAVEFFNRVTIQYPDFKLAEKLKGLYEKGKVYNDELDQLQGGFWVDDSRFNDDDFNKKLSDILYKLGDLQDEILTVVNEDL